MTHSRRGKSEKGFAMLTALVFLSLVLVLTAGVLNSAATNNKTRALVKTRTKYYYEAEETLNGVVKWLQANSKSLVTAFTSANFNSNFDLGTPSYGTNEGQYFGTATLVKMKNTTDSPMLSNNTFFGQASFPTTVHIDTNAAFDPASAFNSSTHGKANARLVLVWARETDGNYEPVFRADVVTGNNPDRGVHSFSYIYSTLVTSASPMGFYGQTALTLNTPNNDCYSYQYSHDGTSWSRGAPRSNCPVGSDSVIDISSKVYGTAKTLLNDGIELSPPGGSVSGSTCDGAGCHSYALPNTGNWDSMCPGVTTDITISANTTWPSGGCWRNVTINNNRTLTLSDVTTPYRIKYINWAGVNSRLNFGNLTPGTDLELYVEQVNNDHINGNRVVNGNNAPHQVRINYIGATALTLNGTANMNGVITAPYTTINVLGNFNYYGAIFARTLDINGNARINFDEALGGTPVVTDMNFYLKKGSQRYR